MVVFSEFVNFVAGYCVLMTTVIGPACPNNDLQRKSHPYTGFKNRFQLVGSSNLNADLTVAGTWYRFELAMAGSSSDVTRCHGLASSTYATPISIGINESVRNASSIVTLSGVQNWYTTSIHMYAHKLTMAVLHPC